MLTRTSWAADLMSCMDFRTRVPAALLPPSALRTSSAASCTSLTRRSYASMWVSLLLGKGTFLSLDKSAPPSLSNQPRGPDTPIIALQNRFRQADPGGYPQFVRNL